MKNRDGTLDLVRGVSALLVMLSHLRAFLFLDFVDLKGTGAITKLFYFSTGLGHQAVMVFFVLSGYFVGGSVLSGLIKKRFTWHGYAIARLTRLWMVLIPALLLTLGLDLLGSHWNPGAYAGDLHREFMSGPTFDHPASWSATAFFGNVFFLQTITVPVFGSNGPLWSLANEFWYYLLFPLGGCGLQAIVTNRRSFGVLLVSCAVFLALWLPRGLVTGGVIWLFGAGVWWVLKQARSGKPTGIHGARQWGLVIGGALFLGALGASKTGHWLGCEYAIGVAFAFWMLFLTDRFQTTGWWSQLVTGLSEISYTLYVIHFPLLFFVAAVFLKGRQFHPDAAGCSLFAGLAAFIFIVSTGMWWLFERNTEAARRWIIKRIGT